MEILPTSPVLLAGQESQICSWNLETSHTAPCEKVPQTLKRKNRLSGTLTINMRPEDEATRTPKNTMWAGPVMMFLSAIIFGYFGFWFTWDHTGVDGQTLAFVIIEEWTLKACAVGFAASGLLALAMPRPAEFLYAGLGLLSAVAFVIAGILELLDDQHAAIGPFMLFIFAAWNGFGSIAAFRALLFRPS